MKGEFYKMDFRAWNNGTVDLSLEQEAAYLRLCHAMYDAGGPVPNSARFLMSIFRCANSKAAGLVRQLVKAGKIQRTPDGLLINRRVTSELSNRERLSETRRAAGELGGKSRRIADAGKQSDPRVTPECGSSDPRVPPSNPLRLNDTTEANASTLRSREEEIREEPPKAPKGAEPEGFVEFREAYPRRSTAFPTTETRKRWLEAIRRGATPAEIIAGAKAYAAEQGRNGKVGTEYVQSANVWLNKQRFRDYAGLALAAQADPAAQISRVSDDEWRGRVRAWKSRVGYWPWQQRTEPPDDPRTKVPAHILAEFNIVHGIEAHRVAPLRQAS